MKRLLLFAVTIAAFAQMQGTYPLILGDPILYANLGTASSYSGRWRTVTDCNSASNCTAGGGSAYVPFFSTGSAWVQAGGTSSGGGVTINTAGQGWTVWPYLTADMATATWNNTLSTPFCVQIVNPYTLTVKTATFYKASANSSSAGFGLAVYDATGTKVTNGDATSRTLGSTGAGAVIMTFATAPVLNPGIYNVCWATDDTALAAYGVYVGAGIFATALNQSSNANAVFFTIGNAATGSGATIAMPATMGTKTLDTGKRPIWFGVLPW